MAGVRQTCIEFVNDFSDKLNKVAEDVSALVVMLKGDIGNLKKENGLLKHVVNNTSRANDGPSKVKMPEPKA